MPDITFATGYTPEELGRLNWAFLSPWLHTEADTLDKVDKGLYGTHLDFFAALVTRLNRAEAIPYDLSEPVARLSSGLQALAELAEGVQGVTLDSLIGRAEELAAAVQALPAATAGGGEANQIANEAIIKASREISFLWAAADKYDQDPYGYFLIGEPVPRLLVPIRQLKGLKEGDQAFNLWMTKFVREKNRVSDALENATDWLVWAERIVRVPN